jgi:hypothetical protein
LGGDGALTLSFDDIVTGGGQDFTARTASRS